MEVICLESEAFYSLVEEVVKRVKDNENIEKDKWIQNEEVMELLGVKSKTTLKYMEYYFRAKNEGRRQHPFFSTSKKDHSL